MSVRAICLVADVWIEIYGGIARFLCDSMAVKGKADSLYRGCLQFENHRRTALQYPLVHWTICSCQQWQQYGAFSMKALARYQVRGTLGVNNLPRVIARIMPRSASNPRPLDHESNALTTTLPSHLLFQRRLRDSRIKRWPCPSVRTIPDISR